MIGIIVLNYNNWTATGGCLNSIFNTTKELCYRVYLVDNASPQKPENDILSLMSDSHVCIIWNEENYGYNKGNNIGIKRALDDGCTTIIISNNDVIFLNDSIKILDEKVHELECNVGIVAPRELTSQMQIRIPTAYHTPSMERLLYSQTGLRRVFRKKAKSYETSWPTDDSPFEVYAAGGGCFAMSRECAELVTPFDEKVFLYCEEWMLGKRMKEHGLRTVVEPKSKLIHNHGETMKGVSGFSQMHMVRSEMYYCKAYLKCSNSSKWLLYILRTAAYFFKALKYKDYRRLFFSGEYFRMTKETLVGN